MPIFVKTNPGSKPETTKQNYEPAYRGSNHRPRKISNPESSSSKNSQKSPNLRKWRNTQQVESVHQNWSKESAISPSKDSRGKMSSGGVSYSYGKSKNFKSGSNIFKRGERIYGDLYGVKEVYNALHVNTGRLLAVKTFRIGEEKMADEEVRKTLDIITKVVADISIRLVHPSLIKYHTARINHKNCCKCNG